MDAAWNHTEGVWLSVLWPVAVPSVVVVLAMLPGWDARRCRCGWRGERAPSGLSLPVAAYTWDFPICSLIPSGFLQRHLYLSSSSVLVFHVALLRHLYHSINSFVLEAPLNNWNE